jgi:hypothetical protein
MARPTWLRRKLFPARGVPRLVGEDPPPGWLGDRGECGYMTRRDVATFATVAVVIPLLIAEPGSKRAASLWDSADRVVSVRLVYPEGRAALAESHGLRGYDTVHLAAADRVRDVDLVVVAGNAALLRAAQSERLAIASLIAS